MQCVQFMDCPDSFACYCALHIMTWSAPCTMGAVHIMIWSDPFSHLLCVQFTAWPDLPKHGLV
eukprot:968376-Rhodomonas_salina.1